MTTTLVMAGLPASFLCMGIVQGAKEAGMPGRFALLLSIFVGLLMGLASQYQLQPHDYIAGAGLGIASGLIASGVYSGVQSISQPKPLQAVSWREEPIPLPPLVPSRQPDPAPAEPPPVA